MKQFEPRQLSEIDNKLTFLPIINQCDLIYTMANSFREPPSLDVKITPDKRGTKLSSFMMQKCIVFPGPPDGDQPRFLMTGHQFQVVMLGVKKGNGAIIVYVYISHRTQSNDNLLELKMVIT